MCRCRCPWRNSWLEINDAASFSNRASIKFRACVVPPLPTLGLRARERRLALKLLAYSCSGLKRSLARSAVRRYVHPARPAADPCWLTARLPRLRGCCNRRSALHRTGSTAGGLRVSVDVLNVWCSAARRRGRATAVCARAARRANERSPSLVPAGWGRGWARKASAFRPAGTGATGARCSRRSRLLQALFLCHQPAPQAEPAKSARARAWQRQLQRPRL